jgi:uncharacterized protein
MTWQIVRLADIPPSPWRNGGGVTRELIAWPDPQAWKWRISVAEVASAGPFSRFEGVQRWLAILNGAGVRLDFPERSIDLTPRDPPLAFSGTDAVHCRLLAGPVRDLNLMVRGYRAGVGPAGQMRHLSGSMAERIETACTVALYNQTETATLRLDGRETLIPPDCLAWRQIPAGCDIEIEAACAIWMRPGVTQASVAPELSASP